MNLTVPTANAQYSVDLYSASGRLVKSVSQNASETGLSVNVTDLSSGVYMLRVVGANTMLTTKALIK